MRAIPLCKLGLVALALTVPTSVGHAEDPVRPVRPVFGVGAGVGFPEVAHLDVGAWIVPHLSIDLRLFKVPGFAYDDVNGVALALTAHFFVDGRDGLMVQGGGVRAFDSDHDYVVPIALVGWERRWTCWDLRLAGGVFFGKARTTAYVDGELIERFDSEPWPMFTMTLIRRLPAPSCPESL